MDDAKTIGDGCPLSHAEQTRNILIVGVNTALSYLASPVMYVGVVHAPLCARLQEAAGVEASAELANLPASGYMVMSCLPVFVAWAYPQARMLKTIIVLCYSSLAFFSGLVALLLISSLSWQIKVAAVIFHGFVVGAGRTTAVACEFEVWGIGVSDKRRGQAVGLAYGVGPILAFIGGLLSQFILAGQVGPVITGHYNFPGNYALLFAASVPILFLGAFLNTKLVIPLPAVEPERQPFLQGVFGGAGSFFGRRVVLLAVISATLVFWGYQVISNFALYQDALAEAVYGEKPQIAGYQNMIRFACKAMMGLAMGWLLTFAAPRTVSIVSATAGLSAVAFALVAPPNWFILCFGLLGMGELFGIYSTNYILNCARKTEMRRFMAFTMMTMLAAAPSGYAFGAITDYFKESHGILYAYRMSFAVACGFIVLGIFLIFFLPARPKPLSKSEPDALATVKTQSV